MAISSKIDEGKKRDKEKGQSPWETQKWGGVVSCAVARASPPLAAAARPLAPAHTVSFTVHETIKPAEAFRATSQRLEDRRREGGWDDNDPSVALHLRYMYVLPYARLIQVPPGYG